MSVRRTLPLVVGIIAIQAFQNCGSAFRLYSARRAAVFDRTVFGIDNVNANVNTVTNVTDEELVTASPTPTPTATASPTATATPVTKQDAIDLPIKRLCDGGKGYWWNYNQVGVMEGNSGVFARVRDDKGNILCRVDNILEQLKTGHLTLPAACTGGLNSTDFMNLLGYTDRTKPYKFEIMVMKGATEWQINDPIKKKDNGKVMQQLDPSWIYMGNNVDGALCDQNLSPLFVDLRARNDADYRSPLTSPAQGVLFDLLGDFPVAPYAAHQKIQISWFKNSKFAFIALPNVNGKVDGINELFGDHTRGPDGQDADNGFAALAKYDGYVPSGVRQTADGVIDSRDWVFSRLRLWTDHNANGISDAGELVPLADVGIKSIDLNFDEHYREMDRHRNEIRFKSTATRNDGRMLLVFDVWFSLPRP